MSPEFLLQLVSIVAVGVGVYGGIRADLARIHEKAEYAGREAERANRRIDDLHNGRKNNET